jgi:hypothetical protein
MREKMRREKDYYKWEEKNLNSNVKPKTNNYT